MPEQTAATSRSWIAELRPGSDLDETYVIRSKEVRQRRGGGSFLVMTLGDRTGQVTGLAWERVDEIARSAEVGRVLRVYGQVQRYNGRLQIVVRDVEQMAAEEVDDNLFVRASEIDPDLLWQRLMELVEGIADADLKQLLFRILADPELAERLRDAPAARSLHHAYRAGLLEHTVSTATVAKGLAAHYRLDASLVVAGTLLHDLGKVLELEIGHSIEYTDEGRLLGHMPLEILYLDRKIAELSRFPAETRLQLLHLLLAHHGEYAYGSSRRPKTPEALLVHMVDNLDSKMAGMLEALADPSGGDESWTAYSRILERHVYRRRAPSADAEPGK
jgi:3'-5' exoribonuclease